MEKFDIDNVLKITRINTEFELEKANSLYNKLRLLVKEDPSLKQVRNHLANLIETYESKHWSDEERVSKEQLDANDKATKLIRFREQFIQQRKKRIKNALKKNDLIQNDLAEILGHRKNYMSELINGVRPFSQEDIIIIHRVLNIKLDHLIVPVIKEPTAERIRLTIKKLNKPKLKLRGSDFNFEVA